MRHSPAPSPIPPLPSPIAPSYRCGITRPIRKLNAICAWALLVSLLPRFAHSDYTGHARPTPPHRASSPCTLTDIVSEDHLPKYFHLFHSNPAKLREKVEWAKRALTNCNLCPRMCGVNRHEKVG